MSETKKTMTLSTEDSALAIPSSNAVSVIPDFALGEMTGELGMEDVKNPTINIIQKSGNLTNDFNFGSIVLSKEHEIATMAKGSDKSTPLTVVILGIQKFFQEVTPFGSGIIPQRFGTLAEVHNAGLSTKYNNNVQPAEKPTAEAVARVFMAIQQPEGLMSDSFPFEIEGTFWTPATWFLAKSAYKAVIPGAITPRLQIELRNTGLLSGRWSLNTEKRETNGNIYCVPNLSLLPDRNSAEFVAEIKDLFGNLG